jgi:hypothetical protein
VLFREPAVLLQLGWAPVQIRAGSNGRHRHPDGRQEESLPCHPDTLRDALRRVGESAWLKAQQAGVQSLYQRQLVRGKVYAVDGSGLGDELRLVALVCVSATRPIIVAWRVLSGTASEKGKEAEVTHALSRRHILILVRYCLHLVAQFVGSGKLNRRVLGAEIVVATCVRSKLSSLLLTRFGGHSNRQPHARRSPGVSETWSFVRARAYGLLPGFQVILLKKIIAHE